MPVTKDDVLAALAKVAAILIAAFITARVFRYSTAIGPTGAAYKTDHWTGKTDVCSGNQCFPISN